MEGGNSYGGGGVGISSTVSCPSIRRVRKLVKRCCSCTLYLTCSNTGLSVRACKFCNTGRYCMGC